MHNLPTGAALRALTICHLEDGVVTRYLGQLVSHVCDVTIIQHAFQIGSGLVRLVFPVIASVTTCHGTDQRCRVSYIVEVTTASQSVLGYDDDSMLLCYYATLARQSHIVGIAYN